jgi:hypothetical protein
MHLPLLLRDRKSSDATLRIRPFTFFSPGRVSTSCIGENNYCVRAFVTEREVVVRNADEAAYLIVRAYKEFAAKHRPDGTV